MSPISHCHIPQEVVSSWWNNPPKPGDSWILDAVASLETAMYFERYTHLMFNEDGEVIRLFFSRVRLGLNKWEVVVRYAPHG